MELCFTPVKGSKYNSNQTCIWGHPGVDWGSREYFSGFNNAYKYGISVVMASDRGMNCNLKDNDYMKNWYDVLNIDC